MKIAYNWIKNYISTEHSAERLAEILTETGLEVEGIEKVETIKDGLEGVVIGHVLTKVKHPDADRLNVTTVDVGGPEILQIVCGAPNLEVGQKVVVATVGCTLYPDPNTPLQIKKSKIRGVESCGMICAEDELGMGHSHAGIMVLDPSTPIGIPAKTFFNISDDYLLEIGLTPNRADAMGHIGVARDLKAYLNFHENANLTLQLPSENNFKAGSSKINLKVENTLGCPRYAGAVITGITLGESPAWLQNRLKIIGLKPINSIVDITNFVMHEIGNPLHAFDLQNLDGNIVVRNAKEGEQLTTLDGVVRQLATTDLVICNADAPMCLAGVFGGLDSGVKETTTSIFIEAAYFEPVTIRKAAKRLGLSTDSSFRFERGVDPNSVLMARDRAISLVLEIAGGTLDELYDFYPSSIQNSEVSFSFDRCRKLIGTYIDNEIITRILNELEIQIIEANGDQVLLNVPAYRVDVKREADVVEEVLRIYGFNKIPLPEKLNTSLSYPDKPNKEKIYVVAANLLVDNGFFEIMNNSLTSSNVWEKITSTHYVAGNDVTLLNPLSNELDVMRQTLLFGGLKSIEFNQNRQNPDLKIFEFGNVYAKIDGNYTEAKKLGIWICGANQPENWTTQQTKTNFHVLKGGVEAVLAKLGILKAPRTVELENDLFADGYGISIANKTVVQLGWVKPEILKTFGVKNTVFYAEFNWNLVIELAHLNKINFKPIPKTQFSRRDFSLLLDEPVRFNEIQTLAQKVDRKILKEIGLFDVYEGKNLEKGKKSYAVSFIFQDDEKTLKDDQIDAIMGKIRTQLEKELGAELR
jgi:phenylalanyl-tRNA synthetase beta chain